MRKVLLPVGKKFNIKDAVRALELLAHVRDYVVTLMSAVEVPLTTPLEERLPARALEEARARLDEFRDLLEELGYRVEVKVLPCRHVHEAIVEEAKGPEYAVIILLKRAKKPLLERSVTAKVVSSTTKPVVVVPVL